jgi:hypothetical protein
MTEGTIARRARKTWSLRAASIRRPSRYERDALPGLSYRGTVFVEPTEGIEPPTACLQNRCSAN